MKKSTDLLPLGQHIRNFRKLNRWSLGAFATEYTFSKAYLWEIENGKATNLSLEIMIKLAQATNTTLCRIAVLGAAGILNK